MSCRIRCCLTFCFVCCFFFFNDTATTEIYTLSLHDALPDLNGKSAKRPPTGRLWEFSTMVASGSPYATPKSRTVAGRRCSPISKAGAIRLIGPVDSRRGALRNILTLPQWEIREAATNGEAMGILNNGGRFADFPL